MQVMLRQAASARYPANTSIFTRGPRRRSLREGHDVDLHERAAPGVSSSSMPASVTLTARAVRELTPALRIADLSCWSTVAGDFARIRLTSRFVLPATTSRTTSHSRGENWSPYPFR